MTMTAHDALRQAREIIIEERQALYNAHGFPPGSQHIDPEDQPALDQLARYQDGLAAIDAVLLGREDAFHAGEPAAPAVQAEPVNGIKATMFHDEGAIAQCQHCKRYSLDPNTLHPRDSKQPVCECGKQHYWSGSFKKPGPDAQWFGAAPTAQPAPKASAPSGEAHPLTLLQAGFNNAELLAQWRKKLPNVEPTDRELSAFAVGTEVGWHRARELEKQDWSRVHHVLAKHGKHPGRTDDHLADVIDRALSAQAAPAPLPRQSLNMRQLADITAPWSHIRSDYSIGIAQATELACAAAWGITLAGITATPAKGSERWQQS